jgi:hypothetical protein
MKITKQRLKEIIKEELENTAEGMGDRDTAGFSSRPWQTPQSGEVDQALKQFVYAQVRSLTSNEELMYEMQQAMEQDITEAIQKVKRDYGF